MSPLDKLVLRFQIIMLIVILLGAIARVSTSQLFVLALGSFLVLSYLGCIFLLFFTRKARTVGLLSIGILYIGMVVVGYLGGGRESGVFYIFPILLPLIFTLMRDRRVPILLGSILLLVMGSYQFLDSKDFFLLKSIPFERYVEFQFIQAGFCLFLTYPIYLYFKNDQDFLRAPRNYGLYYMLGIGVLVALSQNSSFLNQYFWLGAPFVAILSKRVWLQHLIFLGCVGLILGLMKYTPLDVPSEDFWLYHYSAFGLSMVFLSLQFTQPTERHYG